MTEKLYDLDAFQRTFSATVKKCIPVQDGYDVVLDRTAFFPEGGGQYGDKGTIQGVAVTDTQICDGTIYHRVHAPLEIGKTVEGSLDWEERFRRMQNHSGEHIISGLVHSTLEFENVGFHLSHREMTIDYSGELTPDDVKRIEKEANRVVWEDRPIRCFYPSPEELAVLPYRSKKELTEAVRIVSVEGIDVCACCAPQVKSTGQIGEIYIVDSMRWKGGTRLTVRCGNDALEEYRTLRQDEKQLSTFFSVPQGQIYPAAERLQKELGELTRKYNLILKENLLLRLQKIPFTQGNVVFCSPTPEAEIMRAAANEGIKQCTGLFVCLSGNDDEGYRYVISAKSGLKEQAKAINAPLSGRGGGNDTMIQGSFSATENAIREFFKEFQI